MFRRKTAIELMCRATGKWAVTDFDQIDRYRVRTTSTQTICDITLRHSDKQGTATRFQCFLPCRFSLIDPPDKYFAWVLMRNWDLRWSAWSINILESCEAQASLSVLIPNVALQADGKLFNEICTEMTEEVLSMHRELRNRFKFPVGTGAMRPAAPAPAPAASVPAVRPGGSTPGIRFL